MERVSAISFGCLPKSISLVGTSSFGAGPVGSGLGVSSVTVADSGIGTGLTAGDPFCGVGDCGNPTSGDGTLIDCPLLAPVLVFVFALAFACCEAVLLLSSLGEAQAAINSASKKGIIKN